MAERALTDFEQVLLGMLVSEPRSGYDLKKLFTATPVAVYRPSSGAIYPALLRLTRRGLLRLQPVVPPGRRGRRVYYPTEAGRAMNLDWVRQSVDPSTIGADLNLHLMRFVLMEPLLPREEVLAFLAGLADALEAFIKEMEVYIATTGTRLPGRHPLLALRHGTAMHQASLDWARSAAADLADR